jgi:hypothetical protein
VSDETVICSWMVDKNWENAHVDSVNVLPQNSSIETD